MFRVEWSPHAGGQLADIWARAEDRNAVTTASYDIDRTLSREHEDAGESRPDGWRILFAAPLAVRFQVYPSDRLVLVSECWAYGRRRR